MEQIYIKDFIGEYQRSLKTPNSFFNKEKGIEFIFKTRVKSEPNKPKHFLIWRKEGQKTCSYFSALWVSNNTTPKDIYSFIVTDTQKEKGVCEITNGSLKIEEK
jgi:hypothetical protein